MCMNILFDKEASMTHMMFFVTSDKKKGNKK